MVDIQSAIAEITRGKKEEERKKERKRERNRERKKETRRQYNVRICYAGRPYSKDSCTYISWSISVMTVLKERNLYTGSQITNNFNFFSGKTGIR